MSVRPKDAVTEALEKVMDLSGYHTTIPSDEELLKQIVDWKATNRRLRGHIHEWKAYLDEKVLDTWGKLTPRKRKIYFVVCKLQAAREEWD